MSSETKTQTDTRSYTVLEVGSPVVITFMDGEVFTADRYSIGTIFVTAFGFWAGATDSRRALIIPMSAIRSLDLTAREIPESEVPKDKIVSVKNQANRLGLSPADG